MKEIISSFMIIMAAAAGIIGGTYAYFFDTESSEGNTFAAQILDMKIRDNNEPFQDGVTATWTAGDVKPGNQYNFLVPFIELKKATGSLDANHTEITDDYSVTEESPCIESDTDCSTYSAPDKMAKQMIITRCVYQQDSGCIDCLAGRRYDDYDTDNGTCTGNVLEGPRNDWKIQDMDGDGKQSFYDLRYGPLDNLPPVLTLPVSRFEMGVKFSEDAGNDFQGDTFNLTMIFTLEQDASQ